MPQGLALNAALGSASPVPEERDAPRPDPVKNAVGHEMERVSRRFFGNSYFRAIDALLLLAAYRVAALVEWLPIEASSWPRFCWTGNACASGGQRNS